MCSFPTRATFPASSRNCRNIRCTSFPGLNTLFNALLNNEDFRKLDFKPLVLTLGGGMAVQKGVAERWKALTGCPVTEGYGLSETSPVATANKFTAGDFTGTIGLPLPSTRSPSATTTATICRSARSVKSASGDRK
jgi:long-chain acyl-CoA synthetase